jgi:hypothetical protein
VLITASDTKLLKVANPVLPYPVYALGSFVAQVRGIEIAAKEQGENNIPIKGRSELVD